MGNSGVQCPCGDGLGGLGQTNRGAASVHLSWQASSGTMAVHVQCRVLKNVTGTYYCLIGFNGGYFGIQELVSGTFGGGGQRVIFSLWDTQAGSPSVSKQGSGVTVQRFGGEGNGLQCFDDTVGWQPGEVVSCMVVTQPAAGGKTYGGFYNRGGGWKQIATVYVPAAVEFRGFYSFVEDFKRNSNSEDELRSAAFGNVWMMRSPGNWVPSPSCTFTQSQGAEEKVEAVDSNNYIPGWRTLETGGNLNGRSKVNTTYPVAATSAPTSLPNLVL